MAFTEKYGPWALVTGASAGMGKEFARQLAEKGLNVALVARRAERLSALAEKLRDEHGIETKSISVDLSNSDFLLEIGAALNGTEIGLLVNNAGFGNTGEFLDNSLEDELRLLHVNCRAPLILAHEFGRQMKARGRGGIIFLASTIGFMAAPLWTNYAASKSYDLLLGEGLAGELKEHGVDVMSLCPGGTRTEFQEVANVSTAKMPKMMERFAFMDAEDVVRIALNKLGKQTTVVAGWQNGLMVQANRIAPRKATAAIGKRLVQNMLK